jgi:ubiquinone/menaquinone biosynthesis C-methylase UbiE
MNSKAEWYNAFYNQKKILTSYAWYEGLSRILAAEKIDISNSRMLEIGSGAGEFLNSLPPSPRVGIDISESALRIAKKKSTSAQFLKAKAESLPFNDARFDIVVFCEVIEHVDNPQKSLQEIHRVLRRNGSLFMSFPNYINPLYLVIRLLATLFRQPQWISLQIVDRYLFYFKVIADLKKNGFTLEHAKGTCYSHKKIPILNWVNRGEFLFDTLGLQFTSFHPVLFLKKTD